MGKVRIGISGWRYPPWRGNFYPPDLVQRDELHYASRQLDSIEINGTFYGLQRPESYTRWYAQTPCGFVFAVKAPRFITHIRRLRDCKLPLANFMASGILDLKEKLGPILWQFPPSMRYDEALFTAFFKLLPRDTVQATALAHQHDRHLAHPAQTFPRSRRRLRHAVEVRHASFVDRGFIALLREYGIGLVIADTAGKWPIQHDVTAGFMYLRLHGDKELYASGYSDAALTLWARRIRAWSQGKQMRRGSILTSAALPRARKSRDVYCYFDNDLKVRAPFDAAALGKKLKR